MIDNGLRVQTAPKGLVPLDSRFKVNHDELSGYAEKGDHGKDVPARNRRCI